MIWTTINIGVSIVLICALTYNSYIQKQASRLSKQALHEIDEYYKTITKTVDAQTKFNDSTVDNIERHEEALRIIVNYIKAGESNVRK